jgi:hypothetical protein
MRDVLVQVGNAEEEFEDAFLTFRLLTNGHFCQRLQSNVGVSEERIERRCVDGFALLARFEGVVGSDVGPIQEMIEAELLSREGRRDRLLTSCFLADLRRARGHRKPLRLEWISSRVGNREATTDSKALEVPESVSGR